MTKLDKILKRLPDTAVEEMQELNKEQLEQGIVASEQAIDTAQTERDGNPSYQAAKQAVKDLSESFRELKKYQTAKIQYALILLQEKA